VPPAEPARPGALEAVRALAGLVALLLLGACATYALALMFSWFAPWDDQGFLMLTVRHLLHGARLYDDVPVPYGPVYYLERWLVHGALGVPLTHDAVRLVAALHWLAAATASALLAAAVTRGGGFPVAAFALALVASAIHLRVVANEPGHPQELAALVVNVSLLAVAVCGQARNRLRLAILGAACAVLVLTKINLGALYGLAVVAALLVDVPRGGAARVLRPALVVAMTAFPLILMREHLTGLWVQVFLALWLPGLLPSLALALRGAVPGILSGRDVVAFLLGAGGVGCVGFLFVVLAGSSVSGALRGFAIDPLAFTTSAPFYLPVSAGALAQATLSAATALAVTFLGERVTRWLLPAAKLWFGGLTLAAATGDAFVMRGPGLPMVSALPWAWLVLVPPERATRRSSDVLPRRLCALVACLMALQLYPVAGSQVAFATAALVPAAMICLSDALEVLVSTLSSAARRLASAGLTGAAILGALLLVVPPAMRASARYWQQTPLDLPGTRWLRIPDDEVAFYRCLARNLHELSDTFVFLNGSNSFYFWAEREPASPITIGHFWGLLNPTQHRRLLDDCAAHERFVFVNTPLFVPSGATGREPLLQYVARSFRPLTRVGPYTIMVRAERRDAAVEPCPGIATGSP
jgi:hypothetical protein